MRQAADILSSAPGMQIRHLEAMKAMATSANSKIIFLPGPSQNLAGTINTALDQKTSDRGYDFRGQNWNFQHAVGARVASARCHRGEA